MSAVLRPHLVGATEYPYDRLEFERLLKAARLGPEGFFMGLYYATFANARGRRVFPGALRAQVECEVGATFVRKGTKRLVDAGFLELVKSGRGKGSQQADEYRLRIPVDLPDRVELLSPDEILDAIDTKRTQKRGKARSVPPEALGTPGDPQTGYPQGESLGAPDAPLTEPTEESLGAPDAPLIAHLGTPGDAFGDARTAHNHPLPQPEPQTPEAEVVDERTDGSVVRENKSPKCEHGLSSAVDNTGRPKCSFCRRVRTQAVTLAPVPSGEQFGTPRLLSVV